MNARHTCPAWCRLDHKGAPIQGHAAELDTFPGLYPIKISLGQPEEDGVRGELFVRVTYGTADGRRVLETSPDVAADWGDLINALTIQNAADVAATLLRSYKLTEADL